VGAANNPAADYTKPIAPSSGLKTDTAGSRLHSGAETQLKVRQKFHLLNIILLRLFGILIPAGFAP